jgi:multiple sugar transport system substrate-binding protein
MFKHKKTFVLSLLLALIATTGLGCQSSEDAKIKEATKPITLKYWRVFDGKDAFDDIINAYQASHPFVNFEYKKLRYEEYEQELLNAMAEDRGPDIFSIHNTWVNEYKSKLAPVPAKITMAYQTSAGGFGSATEISLKEKSSITLKQLRDNFPDIIAQDIVLTDYDTTAKKNVQNIYGLPLSMDTMVMFYNRDLLNAAKIAQAPGTWRDFQQATAKLTKQDKDGNIIQSGTALGTANNVERFFDIVSLLMMQNGTKMTDEKGNIYFDKMPSELSGRAVPPGQEALIFYTDFASPSKEVYSWNETMQNNLTAFTSGKLAFFFGYSYHIPTIRANAPKLNLGIAKMPQIEGAPEINYANYWFEVVSKKSANSAVAWDFVQFAADAAQVSKYLNKANRPAALRALIETQINDLDLGTFAAQTLTAESWYRGNDSKGAEDAFALMISSVIKKEAEVKDAIDLAAKRVANTLR